MQDIKSITVKDPSTATLDNIEGALSAFRVIRKWIEKRPKMTILDVLDLLQNTEKDFVILREKTLKELDDGRI